jgi:predicted molibdopterin-dependent oxidoreductase YjgC
MWGDLTRSIRRGSATMSLAPAGTQDFKSVEDADVILVIGANPTDGHPVFGSRIGEWQTRAQVSTLLLPNAARTSFWTR